MSEYRVFFSHGSGDKYIVENFLSPELEKSGAGVFLDSGEINFGDDYREIIISELKECDELIVFLTQSSKERPWVFAEIGATIIRSKRIVAMIYGTTEEELQKLGILSLLGTSHLLRLDDYEEYINQLSVRVKEKRDQSNE